LPHLSQTTSVSISSAFLAHALFGCSQALKTDPKIAWRPAIALAGFDRSRIFHPRGVSLERNARLSTKIYDQLPVSVG
jgi:hypothetical protein